MPANLTIFIGSVAGGAAAPITPTDRPVYLTPSRKDGTFLIGGKWLPWDLNVGSDPGYRDCWRATTNGFGYATFTNVPFTDTEMHRPNGPSGSPIGPEIEWNLINPWGSNGTVVYSGKLLSTMVLPTPVNVPDDVIVLATNAWRVSGSSYLAIPIGGKAQFGELTFPVGVTTMVITFIPTYTAPPSVIVGQEYDKDGNHSAAGVAQDNTGARIISTTQATIQIAAGLASDVVIPYLVNGS
mgnify:CR=1 FL=1